MIKIHPTAIIEENVTIGEGTSVWDNVHIRHGAQLGEECIVGEKTYIAYDVRIGNRVKINAMVYICAAVTIEDGVMISASTTFTNDRFPRATFPDLKTLRPSEPDEHTLPTLVREGATVGAGCIIGNDLEIGRWSMVGMGSVVTKSIPDFHLVLGSPARSIGAVCKCGQLFHRFDDSEKKEFECACGLQYEIENRNVKEIVKNKTLRRPNLNFEEMEMPIGSILYCTKSGENAEVVKPKKILFRNEEISLSKATQNVLGISKAALDSFKIWTYKGRNFMDIYDEKYPKQ
jgi:acetyltransferase-like isoleucine patch superfamily enzyme